MFVPLFQTRIHSQKELFTAIHPVNLAAHFKLPLQSHPYVAYRYVNISVLPIAYIYRIP